MKIKDISKYCVHYRERISECRNCNREDAFFKICFEAKKERVGKPRLGIVDVD